MFSARANNLLSWIYLWRKLKDFFEVFCLLGSL
jgi:hypothetical protein